MSILIKKCSKCLHSEVCNLQEQVKFIQDSMRVTIEDCDHFLSEVNWIGSSEDDDEEEDMEDEEDYSCYNQCRCENCGQCNSPSDEEEEVEDTQEEESNKVWESILADLDNILKGMTKKPEPKTRKLALDIPGGLGIVESRVRVASGMRTLLCEGHEPISLTVTTQQLKSIVGKVPEDLDNLGIMVCGTPIELLVNDNITSSYIRYIPKEGK